MAAAVIALAGLLLAVCLVSAPVMTGAVRRFSWRREYLKRRRLLRRALPVIEDGRRGRRGRRRGHWRGIAGVLVLFTVACAAVVQLAERVWPLAVVGLVAVVVYRARRAEPAEVGQLRAERDDLRRQVAKLEQDAARHDQLVSDLEDAAGRPIEAVIASYRHVQRQYGPAAVGKTGRAR